MPENKLYQRLASQEWIDHINIDGYFSEGANIPLASGLRRVPWPLVLDKVGPGESNEGEALPCPILLKPLHF